MDGIHIVGLGDLLEKKNISWIGEIENKIK